MKHGIYYAYWEKEWAADYTYYVDKVARLGFDIFRSGAPPRCRIIRRSRSARSVTA